MKPIKLTEKMKEEMRSELISQILEKFKAELLKEDAESALAKTKMSDGAFKFIKEFKYEKKFVYKADKDQRVALKITPEAYGKMLTIIMSQDKEVAWHGVTERVSATEFIIKDIVVYPQEVTAATVDTDDEEYAKWMIQLPDEVFNNMHFQGHSHVNMAVSPSTTDMGHRAKITTQLGDEDYYIFMIWNKKLQWSGAIYDMPTNRLYETEDIDVVIQLGDNMTAGDVVRDLKDKVKEHVYTPGAYQTGGYYGGYQYDYGTKKNQSPASTTSQGSPKKEENGIGNDPDDFRNRYPTSGRYPSYFGWEEYC